MSVSFSSVWNSRRLQWFFEPQLTCICLVLLFLLTFFGTVHQVHHGLYAAQQKFFYSYFLLLWDWLPFPGTQLVLAVLTFNLLGYLVNHLTWGRMQAGILLIHGGLLMMLIGGAITHRFAQESHLTLTEGTASNVTAAYREWELALVRDDGDRRDVRAVDTSGLRPGQVVDFAVPGITVRVEKYHASCLVNAGGATADPPLSRINVPDLREAPLSKEPERNIAGGIFVAQADSGTKRFLLFGEDDVSAEPVDVAGTRYWLMLRHKRFPMPMTIQLEEFDREMHPGTGMARSYSSRVKLMTGGVERDVTISMNKPLRHRGFTLYQASFSQDPRTGAESSTLAVVHNYGRLLPYVSTGIIVAGMIWHFVAMLVRRTKRRERAA